MDGREIPGFYYDREKKKYFKIQASHQGPRPDSKYTKDNIKQAQKEQKKAEKLASFRIRRKKQTFPSSIILTSPISFSLHRELGHAPRGLFSVPTIWPRAITSGYSSQILCPEASIRYFDLDAATNSIYAAYSDCGVRRLKPRYSHPVPDPDQDYPPAFPYSYDADRGTHFWSMTSQISSLNYLASSGALMVTSLGSDRPPTINVSDPSKDGPGIAEVYTPSGVTTIWTASPLPPASVCKNSVLPTATEIVAIGASRKLITLCRGPDGAWKYEEAAKFESDVQALAWVSENTLSVGCRDSTIHIWDLRSRGSAHVLTHTSPVSALRATDHETRILCSGMQDTLVLYDWRNPKPRSQSRTSGSSLRDTSDIQSHSIRSLEHIRKRRRKNRPQRQAKVRHTSTQHFSTHPPSQPILQFPLSNAEYPDLGLDVYAPLSLVAAADEDDRILIYNLRTGKLLRELESMGTRRWDTSYQEQVLSRNRCVRFVEDDGGGVSVWGCFGGGIGRVGW
ncbi:hypothetical protein K469DRAFT_690588 [Zopfia rhizophila CBS 207.26]|uniref:GCM domain-containing protein n=1 Tax=Zopfia rhizophila CBS 207.26 TaxID=1314779 RepID=A0A6A6DTF1_9PEZI|nr:hypothetical protein K469DRAFT_690588 [Zopfia rhizophila CBS 207.26]